MDKQLEDVYMTMVVTESAKADTVNTKVKAGDSFEGAEKAKKMSTDSGPEGKGNKIDKPVEGQSMSDASVAEGKGKPIGKKEGKMKEAVETKDEKLMLTFDELYNKTITEEEDSDVVPAPDVEGSEFSETNGDFEEENDIEEEVDVASELRLLADRLSEIADKLSVDEGGEEMGEDIPAEGSVEEPLAPEAGAVLGQESVQVTEAIKSEPTPKPLKKTTLNPKMSQNPKNKIGKSGAGKASMPKVGKDRTGTLSNAPKTTLGPKMSQNVTGSGPAVKGAGAPLVA